MTPPPADKPRRAPTDPSLHGVAGALDEHWRKLDQIERTQGTHSGLLSRVEAQVHLNTADIDSIKHTLVDHNDRLVDVERLPRARAPYPSRLSILEDDDAEETSPGGHLRVDRHKIANMERTLDTLREQVNARDQALDIEKERADAVEKERLRVAAEAKLRSTTDDAKIKKWIGFAVSAGPVGVGVWEAAKWLLVHVFHVG